MAWSGVRNVVAVAAPALGEMLATLRLHEGGPYAQRDRARGLSRS